MRDDSAYVRQQTDRASQPFYSSSIAAYPHAGSAQRNGTMHEISTLLAMKKECLAGLP
jgi:hypothetical protein